MEGDKSEWNEQKQYAEIFFKLCSDCRNAQIIRDLEYWRKGLEAKMCHVSGICTPKEKEKFKEIRKNINEQMKLHNGISKNNLKELDLAKNTLIDVLIDAEADIDTITNGHMPFLRIESAFDIQGL